MAARKLSEGSDQSTERDGPCPKVEVNGPTFDRDDVYGSEQRPQDCVDEALMESFPCSDPPAYSCCHI